MSKHQEIKQQEIKQPKDIPKDMPKNNTVLIKKYVCHFSKNTTKSLKKRHY